jgi:hypothetical protein
MFSDGASCFCRAVLDIKSSLSMYVRSRVHHSEKRIGWTSFFSRALLIPFGCTRIRPKVHATVGIWDTLILRSRYDARITDYTQQTNKWPILRVNRITKLAL